MSIYFQASDLGVGPISVTAERETVIDFTAPYYDYAGLQIVMRDPKGPKSLFIFTTVFTNYVWLAWFSLLIGTAFLLYGYHRFRSYMLSKGGEETQPILFDLKDSFWFVMASITLAGRFVLKHYVLRYLANILKSSAFYVLISIEIQSNLFWRPPLS